jgi:hypothetical protein
VVVTEPTYVESILGLRLDITQDHDCISTSWLAMVDTRDRMITGDRDHVL